MKVTDHVFQYTPKSSNMRSRIYRRARMIRYAQIIGGFLFMAAWTIGMAYALTGWMEP